MSESVSVGTFDVRVLGSLKEAAEILLPGEKPTSGFALAVNPEKVMMALGDAELAEQLSAADFCYPDGIGVVWAMRKKGAPRTVRIPGAELWVELQKRCALTATPVFLLGSSATVLEATRSSLIENLPALNIVGARDGYFSETERAKVIEEIASSGARFVSVALGSPRQEIFIREALERVSGTLFMGVGGSYDVYVGSVKRAPAAWRRLGLEWLYRLISQPSRWRRQLVLLRFVARVIRKKI